mmetsp:Transcript_17752/g.21292  ORF Transcript_17752/g.21292 Transcript_17752/m.21292 type:complete len:290 (+) Transcript_17752:299-1168(+)|eukprot:CAMPEP_0197865166 /NCGR_PEP_ID=MMETSP1438-20131217/43506_1 /TAXON_ID=1461541 /ORGANISM="Pterosperma sp., Strain CCMP1384" /LENGTH=289 /DNA_ID=CAMNT_0043483589 /DNA_START=279 /DNA_END=1148 /DNA_ORIENTATION=-
MDFADEIKRRISEFEFVEGVTPLSTWHTPVVAAGTYLSTLALCKRYVAQRGKPFDKELTAVVVFHNLFLSAGSLLLLVALVYQLTKDALTLNQGPFTSVYEIYCDRNTLFAKGPLIFVYYVNYLFKFYEMGDTVLLCLRGKPTPFLHVYHHAATLALCWSQLLTHSTVQWVPILLNLTIHVVMYYYYAVASMGQSPWWKKYLTTGQIIQFVIDVVVCSYATARKYLYVYSNGANPWGENCGGNLAGAFFGTGLLFSYLVLFIQLYVGMYMKKGGKDAKKVAKKRSRKAE